MHTMDAGSFSSMLFAALPIAMGRMEYLSHITADNSLSTIPLPCAYTVRVVEPKSRPSFIPGIDSPHFIYLY